MIFEEEQDCTRSSFLPFSVLLEVLHDQASVSDNLQGISVRYIATYDVCARMVEQPTTPTRGVGDLSMII